MVTEPSACPDPADPTDLTDQDGRGLVVEALTVRFGRAVAVDDVSLTVAPGEVVALLGPSGCGKSTLLRAVAGLEPPDTGRILWSGTDLTRVPLHRRDFGLMFQDHALFAHRRVGENVAFGLRMAGLDRATAAARVAEVLDLVGLAGFEQRSIETLSGGEAQRVALARSLAPSPRLLMLDEPLGSLDRRLRDRLAADLRRILPGLGLAAIHVTHDQEEAYAVADRLVVMAHGRVVASGTAEALWRGPRSAFTARFLGHPNVLAPGVAAAAGLGDGSAAVVVPSTAVTVDAARPSSGEWTARVLEVRFGGGHSRVTVEVIDGPAPWRGTSLVLELAEPPSVGAEVPMTIDCARVAALPDRVD